MQSTSTFLLHPHPLGHVGAKAARRIGDSRAAARCFVSVTGVGEHGLPGCCDELPASRGSESSQELCAWLPKAVECVQPAAALISQPAGRGWGWFAARALSWGAGMGRGACSALRAPWLCSTPSAGRLLRAAAGCSHSRDFAKACSPRRGEMTHGVRREGY